MLNIIDQYNRASRIFLTSLWQAGFQHPSLSLEDDGYLPDHVFSVYQYFMGEIDQDFQEISSLKDRQPRYFNEVPVPRYWEIAGDNQSAKITDFHHLRAKIFYAEPLHLRQVKRVDWYDDEGIVRLVDCYNKYGRKFAEMIFDAKQTPVQTIFYHVQGYEVIILNHVTQDIILNDQNQFRKFNNYLELVHFFLNECLEYPQDVIFNTLSYSFFVAHQRKKPGRNLLFWQENIGDQVPGNMLSLLSASNYRGEVIVPNRLTYQKLTSMVDHAKHEQLHLLGYCYPHPEDKKGGHRVLICTNSDQIEQLHAIVTSLPQLEFHIAALTEMSTKLVAFEQFKNVFLYPNVAPDKMKDLWRRSDIYLDINRGNEILSAVEQAYLNHLIILAFEETLHNEAYVAPQHCFGLHRLDSLIETLDRVSSDPQWAHQALTLQKYHANEISIEEFQAGLKGVLND